MRVATKRGYAMVLAGGEGKRLMPLTIDRAKPAVPFGGNYRLIDFALSNLVNAVFRRIAVLTQYKSHSLDRHISSTWALSPILGNYVATVPAQMRRGPRWFAGSADAIYQNLNLIFDEGPDYICVFGADHIYRMDPSQIVADHLASGASLTIAAIRSPIEQAGELGVIETVADGTTISAFREKPSDPIGLSDAPHEVLASMGNYVFNKDVLVDLLKNGYKNESDLDFGKNLLPDMLKTHKLFAYDFSTNVLPGIKLYEEEGYWRDVGTIQSFYNANMDILGARPKLNMNNRRWFIHSGRYDGPPAKILDGKVTNSIISDGCFVRNATIKNSIIGRGVHVHDGAVIEDSIIMDFCKIRAEAKLKRVVVDRFNEIAAKEQVGYNAAKDAQRWFVDASGIVVLPRGKTPGRQ